MNKNISFKIGGCYSGDLIYILAGIKHFCESHGTKADIYIWMDRPVKSYDGASHPYEGKGFNDYVFEMLKPLVESQPYIGSLQKYSGQQITVDLDELRTKTIAPMPYGSIARWAGYAWPDMQADVSKPWIELKGIEFSVDKVLDHGIVQGNKIIINRTSRWRNSMVHYWFLRDFKEHLIFAGLPEEHADFCKEWELDIPLLKVNDFLELAVALRSCR